ncbi:nitroreductase family protein [Thermodesulfobacteriota bacterium]
MEFFEVVKKRRSVRSFKTDPVPEGTVEKILDTARWAMSGANGQPWEFVVVTDRETKEKIAEVYVEHNRKRVYGIEQTRDKDMRHPMFRSSYSNPPGWKDAPVLIAVCGDQRTFQATALAAHFFNGEGGPMGTYLKNMGNTTQLICLSAAALGLGAQWVSVNLAWERRVKAILDVPDDLLIHSLVPVGYPTYEPSSPYRRDLDELVHYGKYDRSRYRTDEDIHEFILRLRKRTKAGYEKVVSE